MKFKIIKQKHALKQSGFTLMEMLIVISIISVLLGLLYGALERAQKFSRRAMAYTEIKNIETAFKQYYAHYATWPSNDVANIALASGKDHGFVIDRDMADILQGNRIDGSPQMDRVNPAAIPFIEFARFSTVANTPVNPFKSINNHANDTTRAYKVLFDTNGDRQIVIPPDSDPDAAAAGIQRTNIIASVVVWTMIPATRTSNARGTQNVMVDTILGSWDSFAAK